VSGIRFLRDKYGKYEVIRGQTRFPDERAQSVRSAQAPRALKQLRCASAPSLAVCKRAILRCLPRHGAREVMLVDCHSIPPS
jgi:hypothetical protein